LSSGIFAVILAPRGSMKCSDEGLEFITRQEGLRLTAYPDPATGGEPWTIGVGHTGPEVHAGMVIDRTQAIDYLSRDVEASERCVNNSVRGNLTQSQFDALVSLVFNIGCGNFGKSTLLKRLNEGDDAAAAQQFLVWDRAAGRQMAGLAQRREREMELFLT